MPVNVETVETQEVFPESEMAGAIPPIAASLPPPPAPPSREELARQMREKFSAQHAAREGSIVDKIRALGGNTEEAAEHDENPFLAPAPIPVPEPSAQFIHKLDPAAIPLPDARPKGVGAPNGVRGIQPKAPVQAPSAKRLGPIGAKLPGSEHIKVRRRDPRTGQIQHIGDYNIRDIPNSMDFESFLAAYVRPTHGGGDFYLVGVDAHGREIDAGIIRLADIQAPTEEMPKGEGMMDLVKLMMMREQEANQRLISMMQGPARYTPPTDPVDQMHKVIGLKKELQAELPSADGPMAAMVHAMQSQAQQQMQMFMAMQAQAQQQQQQMMALLAAGRNETDPLLAMLLAKMDDKDKHSANAPLPPPPPVSLLGGIDLNALLPTLLGSLPAIVEMFRRKEDPSVELLKNLVLSQRQDGLSTRDVIELITHKTGTDDFKAAAENMSMLLNIQSMMQERMGGGGGFFDSIGNALGALFSNNNFAGSLAENIQATAAQKRQAAEPQQQDMVRRLQAERMALVRERAAIAEERKRLAAAAPQSLEAHAAVAAAPAAKPKVEKPKSVKAAAPIATQEEREAAATRVKQRSGGQLPEFPPELPEHLNRWLDGVETTTDETGKQLVITAVNDAKLLEGVVNTFVFLFQVPTWQPLVGQLFQAVQADDASQALPMVQAFIEAFEAIGALDPAVGQQAYRALEEHFEAVVRTLRGYFGKAQQVAQQQKVVEDVEQISDVSDLYADLSDDEDDEEDDEEDEDEDDEDEDDEEGEDEEDDA